jgi:predicted lactoylglutathione lyase
MNKQIFVNLPVKDLDKSKAFFNALGYTFNPQFTNESGACMVIADGSIYAMLLTEPFFKTFIDKPIVQAKEATEVLVCLSCESREEVDDLVAKASAAGARAPRPPQDHGFMYGHAFEDLDGHIWELVWMAA